MKKLNNQIKESYCSFKVSKILKDKGFSICTDHYYEHALTSSHDKQDGYTGPFGWKKGETNFHWGNHINNSKYDYSNSSWFLCSAPTHALTIEWIRVNFNIWIHIKRFVKDKRNRFEYYYEIQHGDGFDKEPIFSGDFRTPQKATEAALLKVLNQLI